MHCFLRLTTTENVNVRLVTLEALTQYSDDAAVREGLVQSISKQDSPLMQAALGRCDAETAGKTIRTIVQKLLQQKDLDNSIRGKIEQTITNSSKKNIV
jgi:hypothetical protein